MSEDKTAPEPSYALHEAARKNDFAAIQRLMHAGENPAETDAAGDTPLHIAIHYRHQEAVRSLLRTDYEGTRQNQRSMMGVENTDKQTPLHFAIYLKHRETVIALIDAMGALSLGWEDVDKRACTLPTSIHSQSIEPNGIIYDTQATLVHLAVYTQQAEVVAALLSIKDCPVNETIQGGDTALHLAARQGNTEITQILLGRGACQNVYNCQRKTATELALEKNDAETARLLLPRYWRPSPGWGESSLDFWENHQSILHDAVYRGHLETVNMLLTHDNDSREQINRQEGDDGYTALQRAVLTGRTDIIDCLIHHGADITALSRGTRTVLRRGEGKTALLIALEKGRLGSAHVLIGHGASLNPSSQAYQNQFLNLLRSTSCPNRVAEALEIFIAHSTDVNQTFSHGYTPLLVAAKNGNLNAVRFLLAHGANCDAVTTGTDDNTHNYIHRVTTPHYIPRTVPLPSGCGALHLAVARNQTEMVRFLLDARFSPNVCNAAGQTPAELATQLFYTETADKLVAIFAEYADEEVLAKQTDTPITLSALTPTEETPSTVLVAVVADDECKAIDPMPRGL